MSKLKFRRCQPSDIEDVWRLHEFGLAEIGGKASPDNPLDKDLSDIEGIYLKEGDFLLGEYEGKVVAMGAFKKVDDKTAELKRMRVHPDYQRRGFGYAILKELEKRAKSMDYKKMVLDTSPKWTKAQNFYKKNGYKETGRNKLSGRNEAIYYEKELK